MSHIDRTILERVLSECTEVRKSELENVIDRISTAYARSMIKHGQADFKAIRDKVLDHCDLWDLFLLKPYKTAVAKYFNYRRAYVKQYGYTVGTVDFADKDKVLVAATPNVKILFRARKARGRLAYSDVDTGLTRFSRSRKSNRVPEDLYLKAKRQALAVMNSRRT